MNDRSAPIGEPVRYGASIPGIGAQRRASVRVRVYDAVALAVVLCLIYLDIPTYVYTLNEAFLPKYFFYAAVVALAPRVLSASPSLGRYLTSSFSQWLLA